MGVHNNMPSKSGKRRQSSLQKFRSEVAALKRAGLVSSKVDARTQRATPYMLKQVEKYRDVIDGKAKAVKTPKRADARTFADKFRVKGKTVVIPTHGVARVRYSKKRNEFTATETRRGKKVTTHYTSGDFGSVIKLPRGRGIMYRISFAGGQIWTFDTPQDLANFMYPYETTPRNPFKNWRNYVEILSVKDAEGDEA